VIRFDNQQLELVLVNILKNAIEAIGSRDEGGLIRVSASGPPAVLTIENNGAPITPETGSRLFEPFFTTKKSGQGIGLTLIREILLNHDSEFTLRTREDGLTEFRIGFSQAGTIQQKNSLTCSLKKINPY
jgi:two-component system nitrogen regulation sensor histidine kinase NtrY